MRLIAIGKLRAGPEADLIARYAARMRPKLAITELPEGQGAPQEIKRREADSISAALPANAFAVALDLGPAAPTSEQLAKNLENWLANGRPLTFVIGGAEGLAQPIIARADHILSLGPLTWPHMLVRVMLAEQLFRAQSILSNHPYHRPGRP
jgi:23S rRNA (pseudouridine1915-N3)-methyltransferase